MDKESRMTQFVTELVVRSNPPVPAKFARAIAVQRWMSHADQPPDKVARIWFEARRSSIGMTSDPPAD